MTTLFFEDIGSQRLRDLFPADTQLIEASAFGDGSVLLRPAVPVPALVPRLRAVPGLLEELHRSFGDDQTFVPRTPRQRSESDRVATLNVSTPERLLDAAVVPFFHFYGDLVGLKPSEAGVQWGATVTTRGDGKINVAKQFAMWARRERGGWLVAVCLASVDEKLIERVRGIQARFPAAAEMLHGKMTQNGIPRLVGVQMTLALPLEEMSNVLAEQQIGLAARNLVEQALKNEISGGGRSNPLVVAQLLASR